MRALFGEAASILLEGQQAIPERSTALGFQFALPSIQHALEDILDTSRIMIGKVSGPIPASEYYALPAGILGGVANGVFIADKLRQVFAYRNAVMKRRFGDALPEDV